MTNKEKSFINTARCYSQAFRGKPWNEAFVNQEGSFVGNEFDLNWANLDYKRAYPLLDTASYIKTELSKPNSVFVAKTDPQNPKRILGFAWGYSVESADYLSQTKWNADVATDISKLITNYTGANPIWYLSEVGVLPNTQNRGLGTSLMVDLVDQAPTGAIIMRTNANSPLTVIVAKLGFTQIMGWQTTKIDGQISVGPNIVNQLDPINPDRVLYYFNKEAK